MYSRKEENDANAKNALQFDEELRPIGKCKAIKITELMNEYNSLSNSFESSKNILKDFNTNDDDSTIEINTFLTNFSHSFANLNKAFDNLKQKGLEMSRFFGEEEKLNNIDLVIELIAEFYYSFLAAKSKYQKKHKLK